MAPKHTPKQKHHMMKKGTSQTPDVKKQTKPTPLRNTPKSAPQAKRKKLSEEIDEQLSDNDFDEILLGLKKTVKGKGENGKTAQPKVDKAIVFDESDEEEEDESSESAEIDSDDVENDEEEEGESEEDDDDDEEDDDEEDSADEEGNDSDEEGNDSDEGDGDEDESDSSNEIIGNEAEEHKLQEAIKTKLKEKAKAGQKRKAGDAGPIKEKEAKLSEVSAKDAKKAQNAQSERDKRTLFMKNLPNDITADKIQEFSADIISVRLRSTNKRKVTNRKYAFLEFDDEAAAEKNILHLKSKKIGDCEPVVDYVGTKSSGNKSQIEPEDLDPLKLYVTGFPNNVTVVDFKKCFPTASSITLPFRKKGNKPLGFAFIHFTEEKTCKSALDDSQGLELKGNQLIVLYGKKTVSNPQKKKEKKSKNPQKKKQKKSKKKAKTSAKKTKVDAGKKMESDEEESDNDVVKKVEDEDNEDDGEALTDDESEEDMEDDSEDSD